MSVELIVALIAAAVSLISVFANVLIAKSNSSKQYTTQQRNEWLKEMRRYSNEYLAILAKGKINDYYLTKLKFEILSRLNVYNINDKVEKSYDYEIHKEITKNHEEIDIEKLRNLFAELFKEEWEKVKLESNGMVNVEEHSCRLISFIYNKIFRLFSLVILPIIIIIAINILIIKNIIEIEQDGAYIVICIATSLIFVICFITQYVKEINMLYRKQKDKKMDNDRMKFERVKKWICKKCGLLIIICIIVGLLGAVHHSFSFAWSTGNESDKVTMIAGWISGVATAILGGIAIWQNARYKKENERNNRIRELKEIKMKLEAHLDQSIILDFWIEVNRSMGSKINTLFVLDQAGKHIAELTRLYGMFLSFQKKGGASAEKIVIAYNALLILERDELNFVKNKVGKKMTQEDECSVEMQNMTFISKNIFKHYLGKEYYYSIGLKENLSYSVLVEDEIKYITHLNEVIDLKKNTAGISDLEINMIKEYIKDRKRQLIKNKENKNGQTEDDVEE